MNYYQEQIVKATGCKESEAEDLEEIMRQDIFHSTLDWQTKKQYNKGAREAYELYLYMRSKEGIEYIKQLEKQIGL